MYVYGIVNIYIWWYGWNLLCSSLPYFRCCVFCCVVLSFAMIINFFVWADARNTRGQQGGDSSAA